MQNELVANSRKTHQVAVWIMQGDSPDQTVNLVSACKQKLRQVRTILSGNACDQSPLLHGA